MLRTFKHNKGSAILSTLVVVLVISFAFQCGVQKVCKSSLLERVVRTGATVELPKGTISVEVADTPQAREQGLSGRSGLDANEGLLFVFDHPGRYAFWMKDMRFPIDIVWINEEGVVVHVENAVSPDTYFKENPPRTFVNTPYASYVLELASGEAERHGVYLGTKAVLRVK